MLSRTHLWNEVWYFFIISLLKTVFVGLKYMAGGMTYFGLTWVSKLCVRQH